MRSQQPQWFWPGATREDKAKHVARAYRQLVYDISQSICGDPAGELHRLDRQFVEHGISWLQPTDAYNNPDDWLSAADVAALVDRTRKDIYNWAHAGHIQQRVGPDGAPQYRLDSVVDYQRKLRARRAKT